MDKPSRRAEMPTKATSFHFLPYNIHKPGMPLVTRLGVGLAWSSLAIPSAIGQLDVIAEVHVPVSAAGSIMNVHDGY